MELTAVKPCQALNDLGLWSYPPCRRKCQMPGNWHMGRCGRIGSIRKGTGSQLMIAKEATGRLTFRSLHASHCKTCQRSRRGKGECKRFLPLSESVRAGVFSPVSSRL